MAERGPHWVSLSVSRSEETDANVGETCCSSEQMQKSVQKLQSLPGSGKYSSQCKVSLPLERFLGGWDSKNSKQQA